MHVAYAELVRTSPEAIRMTGFGYGQADDAVEAIVWSEAVLGRGYDLLRLADDRRPTGGWPTHSVNVSSNTATVDLAGVPAYSLAARFADLATELGSTAGSGAGVVRTYGGFGGWIAPYIAYRLARNSLHSAVFWRPADPALTGEAPAILVIANPASPAGSIPPFKIVSTEAFDGGDCPLESFPAPLLAPLVEAGRLSRGRSLLVLAGLTGASSGATIQDAVAFAQLGLTGPARRLDAAKRLDRAVTCGMEVPAEKHGFLNALSQRIRMPNTERSKSQAG